jgi:hypothetical protein
MMLRAILNAAKTSPRVFEALFDTQLEISQRYVEYTRTPPSLQADHNLSQSHLNNLQLTMMSQPQPFRLHVPDGDLQLLESKLSTTRLPNAPDGWNHSQGVPLLEIERVLNHWRTSYLPRWRDREAELNKLPMFKMPVDAGEFGTLDIHFMHKKSKKDAAIPLLFIHGWPGCFLEGTKLLNALSEGDELGNGPVFDIVVPSLPNYGFSEGVTKVCVCRMLSRMLSIYIYLLSRSRRQKFIVPVLKSLSKLQLTP